MMSAEQIAQMQAMMQQAHPPKPIVEFRAGVLTQTGTRVKADPRRGKVQLILGEDGLLHFQWVQRPSGTLDPADDLVLFPRAAVWEKVPECKDGRVYLLRFKQGSRKRFFWMQEPKDDQDAEFAKKINETIDKPPVPNNALGAAGAAGGMDFGDDLAGLGDGMADEMNQAQLLAMLENSRPAPRPAAASATPARPASTSGSSTASASASTASASTASATPAARPAPAAAPAAPGRPANNNNNAGARPNTSGDAAYAALMNAYAQQMQQQQQQESKQATLVDVVDADRVLPLLDDKAIEQLLPLLPEGQRTPADLRAQLRSPQLRQTLVRLHSTLNSAQYGQLMASLGLSHSGNLGVSGFVEAIEKQVAGANKPAAGAPAGNASASAPSSSSSSSSSSSTTASTSSTAAVKKDEPTKKP